MPSAIVNLLTAKLEYLRMKVEGPMQCRIEDVSWGQNIGPQPELSIENRWTTDTEIQTYNIHIRSVGYGHVETSN